MEASRLEVYSEASEALNLEDHRWVADFKEHSLELNTLLDDFSGVLAPALNQLWKDAEIDPAIEGDDAISQAKIEAVNALFINSLTEKSDYIGFFPLLVLRDRVQHEETIPRALLCLMSGSAESLTSVETDHGTAFVVNALIMISVMDLLQALQKLEEDVASKPRMTEPVKAKKFALLFQRFGTLAQVLEEPGRRDLKQTVDLRIAATFNKIGINDPTGESRANGFVTLDAHNYRPDGIYTCNKAESKKDREAEAQAIAFLLWRSFKRAYPVVFLPALPEYRSAWYNFVEMYADQLREENSPLLSGIRLLRDEIGFDTSFAIEPALMTIGVRLDPEDSASNESESIQLAAQLNIPTEWARAHEQQKTEFDAVVSAGEARLVEFLETLPLDELDESSVAAMTDGLLLEEPRPAKLEGVIRLFQGFDPPERLYFLWGDDAFEDIMPASIDGEKRKVVTQLVKSCVIIDQQMKAFAAAEEELQKLTQVSEKYEYFKSFWQRQWLPFECYLKEGSQYERLRSQMSDFLIKLYTKHFDPMMSAVMAGEKEYRGIPTSFIEGEELVIDEKRKAFAFQYNHTTLSAIEEWAGIPENMRPEFGLCIDSDDEAVLEVQAQTIKWFWWYSHFYPNSGFRIGLFHKRYKKAVAHLVRCDDAQLRDENSPLGKLMREFFDGLPRQEIPTDLRPYLNIPKETKAETVAAVEAVTEPRLVTSIDMIVHSYRENEPIDLEVVGADEETPVCITYAGPGGSYSLQVPGENGYRLQPSLPVGIGIHEVKVTHGDQTIERKFVVPLPKPEVKTAMALSSGVESKDLSEGMPFSISNFPTGTTDLSLSVTAGRKGRRRKQDWDGSPNTATIPLRNGEGVLPKSLFDGLARNSRMLFVLKNGDAALDSEPVIVDLYVNPEFQRPAPSDESEDETASGSTSSTPSAPEPVKEDPEEVLRQKKAEANTLENRSLAREMALEEKGNLSVSSWEVKDKSVTVTIDLSGIDELLDPSTDTIQIPTTPHGVLEIDENLEPYREVLETVCHPVMEESVSKQLESWTEPLKEKIPDGTAKEEAHYRTNAGKFVWDELDRGHSMRLDERVNAMARSGGFEVERKMRKRLTASFRRNGIRRPLTPEKIETTPGAPAQLGIICDSINRNEMPSDALVRVLRSAGIDVLIEEHEDLEEITLRKKITKANVLEVPVRFTTSGNCECDLAGVPVIWRESLASYVEFFVTGMGEVAIEEYTQMQYEIALRSEKMQGTEFMRVVNSLKDGKSVDIIIGKLTNLKTEQPEIRTVESFDAAWEVFQEMEQQGIATFIRYAKDTQKFGEGEGRSSGLDEFYELFTNARQRGILLERLAQSLPLEERKNIEGLPKRTKIKQFEAYLAAREIQSDTLTFDQISEAAFLDDFIDWVVEETDCGTRYTYPRGEKLGSFLTSPAVAEHWTPPK